MTTIHKPAQPVDPCELGDLVPDTSDEPAPWWQQAVWAVEDSGTAGLLAIALLCVLAALGFVHLVAQ